MDMIYTNAKRIDQGVLHKYAFDLSFGAEENDFAMILGANEPTLEFGAFVYIESTEYGGIVDAVKTTTDGETITYMGRTWHGVLNSKVIEPDAGEAYLTVNGNAYDILTMLVSRLGLESLFRVDESAADVTIKTYKFHRYCQAYAGILDMLSGNSAKLQMTWKDRYVYLSAVPISDYTDSPVDGDLATLAVEQHGKKPNHLVCLGKGDLTEREVIHLYVDQFGRIGTVQYYTGLDDYTQPYENTSTEDLLTDATKHFKELLDTDTAEIALAETDMVYDINDIVGAIDRKSGISATTTVTQKIVKINNGVVTIEYKTGR